MVNSFPTQSTEIPTRSLKDLQRFEDIRILDERLLCGGFGIDISASHDFAGDGGNGSHAEEWPRNFPSEFEQIRDVVSRKSAECKFAFCVGLVGCHFHECGAEDFFGLGQRFSVFWSEEVLRRD